MESPIVTMDRRNRNYLNPSFPSGSKPHSLPHRQLKPFKKHPSHLPAPLRSRSSSSTSHHNLPTNPRKKMAETATKKRARSDEPFCDPEYDTTGLELVEGPPTKKVNTGVSTFELKVYKRRMKRCSPTDIIRKKRALAQKLSSSWSQMPGNAQQGMRNLTGSLCYRLSLLQSLLHQPQFVYWIQNYHREEFCVSDNHETCVSCSIRRLTLEYWSGARSSAALTKVLQAMQALLRTLGWKSDVSSGHADPDEQGAWIFNVMSKELPSSIFEYFKSFCQLITTSSIRCQKCGHESRTTGHGDQSLSIPITPKLPDGTLAMYLHKYMVEVVEGYKCEKCENDSKKQRVLLIGHSPDVLTIQLKRFDWDGTKVNTPVRIPTSLDLDNYRDVGNDNQMRYELTAVIKHVGSGGFGHYVCDTKAGDGEWYHFDDDRKSRSNVARATASTKSGFTPYILFFKRAE